MHAHQDPSYKGTHTVLYVCMHACPCVDVQVNTKVDMRFDLDKAGWIPDEVKEAMRRGPVSDKATSAGAAAAAGVAAAAGAAAAAADGVRNTNVAATHTVNITFQTGPTIKQ